MAMDGKTGRRVNGQSLYITRKKLWCVRKTMTHLVLVCRATPRDELSLENERVFSDGVGREPVGDERCAVKEVLCAEVSRVLRRGGVRE